MASRQRPRWGTGPAPTHRDVDVLAWVAEQYAVRADTLGLLLGRRSPESPRTVHRWQYAPGQWAELPALSEATVRYHLRRWLRAGWIRPQRALGHTWVIPTRAGLDLAGSGYRPWTLVPSQLQHLHAVAVVRLAIEAANPDTQWVSERELTRLRAQRREAWWRPDGGLVVADAAVNGGPPLTAVSATTRPPSGRHQVSRRWARSRASARSETHSASELAASMARRTTATACRWLSWEGTRVQGR